MGRPGEADVECPNTTPLLEAPELQRRSTLLTVCPFILGNEFCERLAFYGLSTNLVVYMTRIMGSTSAFAATQLNLFEGTCYLTPLLGAWLADARWGRYKTIIVFSVIYLLGMLTLSLSAAIPGGTPAVRGTEATAPQSALLYAALYIVALGTGGIKPNVSAFGADQFDETDAQDRKEKESFFNWFYFAINVGSLLAVTLVVYIQENISWAVGFAVPAFAMLVAICVFVAGSSNYTHVEPTESPMTRVASVVYLAARNGYAKWQRPETPTAVYVGSAPLPEPSKPRSLGWLDLATEPSDDCSLGPFSPSQVEEVRMVLRMLPVFVTTIFYWTIYMQMGSFFVVQGGQMDRNMLGFRIPAASLALFNTISICILIPLYDRGLIPLLRRLRIPMTLLQRIGWGLLVCVAAMLASYGVEFYRLKLYAEGRFRREDDGMGGFIEVVDMSVFWQVPQYLLIGLSEVLASIGQLEFFYDQAPDVMRSCSMALQLLSVCIGSYLAGAVVIAVDSLSRGGGPGPGWLPADLNEGRLDLFFLLLAGLMAANTVIFVWVAIKYEYKVLEHVPHLHLAPEDPHRKPPAGHASRAPRTPPPTPPAPQEPLLLEGPPQPAMSPQHPAGTPTHEMPIAGARPHDDFDPSTALYGRSLAFVPPSPALPAPFR